MELLGFIYAVVVVSDMAVAAGEGGDATFCTEFDSRAGDKSRPDSRTKPRNAPCLCGF